MSSDIPGIPEIWQSQLYPLQQQGYAQALGQLQNQQFANQYGVGLQNAQQSFWDNNALNGIFTKAFQETSSKLVQYDRKCEGPYCRTILHDASTRYCCWDCEEWGEAFPNARNR